MIKRVGWCNPVNGLMDQIFTVSIYFLCLIGFWYGAVALLKPQLKIKRMLSHAPGDLPSCRVWFQPCCYTPVCNFQEIRKTLISWFRIFPVAFFAIFIDETLQKALKMIGRRGGNRIRKSPLFKKSDACMLTARLWFRHFFFLDKAPLVLISEVILALSHLHIRLCNENGHFL